MEYLKNNYPVIVDLSGFEEENKFLEGGGSIISDSLHKVAFMALSERSSIDVGETYARILGRKLVTFKAVHSDGEPLYHTSLVIAVCRKFGTKLLLFWLANAHQ